MKQQALKLLHPLRRIYWRVARPKTFGVKVAVYSPDDTKVILVQHRYGSQMLMLPGGAIERGETEENAARREIKEELDIEISDLRLRHTFVSDSEGKRDTVYLFSARSAHQPIPNPSELSEAYFVTLDDLPDATSPATRRRLNEIRSNSYSTKW